MANPIFIHVTGAGEVWYSIDQSFTPVGTVLASYRVYSSAATQRLGTLTGNAGSYAASGGTGKFGRERT